jgi:hypothetical protein
MSKKAGKSLKNRLSEKEAIDDTAQPSIIKNNLIPVLIFLAAFFFIITFSNPALYINDEWITANQLHQLDIGHQAVYNEGKYGVFSNGTAAAYFQTHNNQLGYTLMLPILSLPMLKLFGIFGDSFRYPVILLWTLLPIIIALLIQLYYPKYSKFHGIQLLWVVTPIMFILFMYNIMNYTIFPYTAADAPIEAAAIVFTQHILFALLCVVIYKICETVFEDKKYSLFGTLAIICCSSYMFWAANAKDHLLIAFILSLVLLCMVKFIKSDKHSYALLAFLLIGLMAWGRPEIAFPIFLFTLIFYLAYQVKDYLKNKNTVSLKMLLVPLITPVGAIPYFLNNLYVMGNPFIPSFNSFSRSNVNVSIATGSGQLASNVSAGSSVSYQFNIFDSINNILNSVLGYYFSIDWMELPANLMGVLFRPENDNMGLLGVAPILGLAIIFLVYAYKRSDEKTRLTIYLMLAVLIGCIFAYLPVIGIMNTDHAISPDMRYLSTAYLPIGILGLFVINSLISKDNKKVLIDSLPKYLIVITPILLIALLLIQPFGSKPEGHVFALTIITYIVLILTIICAVLKFSGKINERLFISSMMILIALPFAWQMFSLFVLSAAKFNGYSYWIPLIQDIYHALFSVK